MSKGRQNQYESGQGRRGCGLKKEDAQREARILQALGRKTRVLTRFNNRPQPMRNEYTRPHLVQQCIIGEFLDGRLADFCEYCVEGLGGERRSDAGGSVYMSRVRI